LFSDDFFNRHRISSKAFNRKRSLPFIIVFLFLINLIKQSLQNELDNFFKIWFHCEMPLCKVTKSAFSQARKKLKYQAFYELNTAQVDYFYQNYDYKTWKNYRLIAIDGSILRLPNSKPIFDEFGKADISETGRNIVYARVSQAYDMLNHITMDASLSYYHSNEHDMALNHMGCLTENDIVLFDRNYPSFWMFALLLSKGTHFCARLKTGSWNAAKEIIAYGQQEMTTEIMPSKASKKKCKEMGIEFNPITLRFICIELETGEKEVLVTDLTNKEIFPYDDFKDLYHYRWFVEESYKQMKSRLEIENFSGKSPLSVKQDFYAKIFTANLTAILASPIHEQIEQKTKERERCYQLNWTQALCKMKNTVVLLFFRPMNLIVNYIKQLQVLFLANIEIVRSGRKNERRFRKSPNIYPTAYKPAM
jgi:hypothetical protein